jgi:acetylglutamate kinase
VTAPAPLTDRTKAAQDKARVLREALPWITRWAGRTVVVKYGGNAMGDDELGATFAGDVALLASVGLNVVVVHGGGPQISALSQRLGVPAQFVDGRRVTDEATLGIVKMVLLGQVNPELVGLVERAGARAVGVAGTDDGLLQVTPAGQGLERVGEVARVDPRMLNTLLADGAVPVVAGLGRGPDGADYNVNADAVAGALATALDADKLIYLTNVSGLYEDFGTDAQTLLSTVTVAQLERMRAEGALHTGMAPKIDSVLAALHGGVGHAHLLDGRIEHALLLEIFTDEGVGTMIVAPGESAG